MPATTKEATQSNFFVLKRYLILLTYRKTASWSYIRDAVSFYAKKMPIVHNENMINTAMLDYIVTSSRMSG